MLNKLKVIHGLFMFEHVETLIKNKIKKTCHPMNLIKQLSNYVLWMNDGC